MVWCLGTGSRSGVDSMFIGTSASKSIVYLHVAELQKQLKSYEMKLQRLKEFFKTTSKEYREACYMLLGYRMDRIEPGLYRLSSMYAESEEDCLVFKVCRTTKILPV
jgi:mitotic spindle assembly checkpoint protein MAD1